MNLCARCFAELKQDSEFCPECGASTSDEKTAQGSDAIVYPALARANLLRMRGNYTLAEETCLSILKRFPHNETAHILLGDIHADQARSADALQWYELALDLAPDNASLRAKVDRAKAAIANQRGDKAELEVRPAGRAPIFIFSAVAILLGVVAAIAFFLGRERARALDEARIDSYTRPIYVGDKPPPSSSSPAPQPDPQTKAQVPPDDPTGTQPAQPAPSTGSPTPAPAGLPAPPPHMTSQEQALIDAVSAVLADRAAKPLSCEFDPRNGSLRLSLSGGQVTEDAVVAAVAANAALSYAQEISRVHVRILDSALRNIRLIATVTRDSLQKASGSMGSQAWARSILTDVHPPEG